MDPDCIMMTETKIDNTVSSAEFMPPNYTCYRKDRKKRGGGVLVAIKSSYPSVEVELNDIDGEMVWATVTLRNQKTIYIGSFYRPPGSAIARRGVGAFWWQ